MFCEANVISSPIKTKEDKARIAKGIHEHSRFEHAVRQIGNRPIIIASAQTTPDSSPNYHKRASPIITVIIAATIIVAFLYLTAGF